MNSPDLLNVAQVAEALGITRRAVVHRITAGTLAAMKLGNGPTSAYVITREELDRVQSESESVA